MSQRPRRGGRIRTILGLATALFALSYAAGAGAAEKKTTFAAAAQEEAAAPAASGDLGGMLARCDQQLEICKKDSVGVPFLATAYMALWAILLIFLGIVWRSQKRLGADIDELRLRLEEEGGRDA